MRTIPSDSTSAPIGSSVHVFEAAGLGKAPFRFVGIYEAKYQACPGAPVQPGASCDYCGASLLNVCLIRSADGREFRVGCDCVTKTGDHGLRKVVDSAVREAKKAAQFKRDSAKVDAIRETFARPDVRMSLAARPHPNADLAARGLTLEDYVGWMLSNAGMAGKLRLAKVLAAA